MSRLSARACRIIAAVGFWAFIAVATMIRGPGGLMLAYAAVIWLAAFSLQAWRSQDEFERAAQKFSWVFGGLFGLMGSVALLPLVIQPGVIAPMLDWVAGLMDAADLVAPAFLLGAVYIVLGQLVGFLVCWVGWHVAKR